VPRFEIRARTREVLVEQAILPNLGRSGLRSCSPIRTRTGTAWMSKGPKLSKQCSGGGPRRARKAKPKPSKDQQTLRKKRQTWGYRPNTRPSPALASLKLAQNASAPPGPTPPGPACLNQATRRWRCCRLRSEPRLGRSNGLPWWTGPRQEPLTFRRFLGVSGLFVI